MSKLIQSTLRAILVGIMILAGLALPSAPSRAAETADWVPFKGSYRVTRTWGHSGGHTT